MFDSIVTKIQKLMDKNMVRVDALREELLRTNQILIQLDSTINSLRKTIEASPTPSQNCGGDCNCKKARKA